MKLRSAYILLLLFLLVNCKDPFTFSGGGSSGTLVIDGGINDGPSPYYLSLGRTNGVINPVSPETGANIILSDDTGITETYEELGLGKYRLNGTTLKGTQGRSYHLNITLANGSTYASEAEKMPALQAKDTASFEVASVTVVSSEGLPVKNLVINIYLSATLPTSEAATYFRWNTDEVYRFDQTCFPSPFNNCPDPCYVYQPVSKSNLQVVSTAEFAAKNLDNILLQTRDIDYTFLTQHYFNVNQYSITKEAYDYWKRVQTLVVRTGGIFDTPPANIPGNIHNTRNSSEEVFGYFEVSLQKVIHVGVAKGYIHEDIYNPCAFKGQVGYSYTPSCLNCLKADGATHQRPDWFN